MAPIKKFYCIQRGESLEEHRRRRGISLSELLEELNVKENKDAEGYVPPKELTFENLPDADRMAQEQLKKLRGALNKLAPDNFYIQMMEIQDCLPVNNAVLIRIFVRQLVQKAIYDTYYAPLYAHLCKALSKTELLEAELEDEPIDTFGELVLDECYKYFSYNRSSLNWFSLDDPNEEEIIALEAKEWRKRKALVGLVRFLGELYKAGMLSAKDIFEYIKKLEKDVNEKCIEGLCHLLSTVGKELEADVFQTELSREWCSTWERIVKLSHRDSGLPLRQMFMLMDLLDLMNNGWVYKRPLPSPKCRIEILMDYQDKERADPSVKRTKAERKSGVMKSGGDGAMISESIIATEPMVVQTEQEILAILRQEHDHLYTLISSWEIEHFKGRKTWLIYSLTRALLRVCIDGNSLNQARFSNYTDLLKKYVSSRQAEVACMYAVQYIVVVEMKNPKGLLESVCSGLYESGTVSYIGLLDWRENWSKHPMLEVRGRSAAHVSLASFFLRLYWDSIKPSAHYRSIVKELNSFDLEHFVSSSKLPPEIAKRIKMEEERDKTALLKKVTTDSEEASAENQATVFEKTYQF